MINFGIRFHDVKADNFDQSLQVVENQGFGCVHLALTKSIKDFSVKNPALTPGLGFHLKKKFQAHHLDIAVLGCYLNLATPDIEEYLISKTTYEHHFAFASAMGCQVVGTETGAPNIQYAFEPACHSQAALDLFIKRLEPVVAAAEKFGVHLAIEPVFNHIVSTVERAKFVLDTIASPHLKIILDPVNLLSISNYTQQEEILSEAFELLGKDIVVVHCKDFMVDSSNATLVSTAIGEGLLNYSMLFQYLKYNKPFIHATLEDTLPSNAVASRQYLQSVFGQI